MTSDADHPLDFDPDEPREPPTFSVLRAGRLIAYVWQRQAAGSIRRAGRGQEPLAAVPWADVVCFDAGTEPQILELAAASPRLATFRFKLGLEGYEIVRGGVAPHHRMRRF